MKIVGIGGYCREWKKMNDWYETSFGDDYLRIYKQRDRHEAVCQVKIILHWLSLLKHSRVLDLCC